MPSGHFSMQLYRKRFGGNMNWCIDENRENQESRENQENRKNRKSLKHCKKCRANWAFFALFSAFFTIVSQNNALFAYELFNLKPPIGGENIFKYSQPNAVSGAYSVAGGPLFIPAPGMLAFNPSLVGGLDRVVFDAGVGLLFEKESLNEKFGFAVQADLLFPTRIGNWTVGAQASWVSMGDMFTGNTVHIRGSYSKDITDFFYFGVMLHGGWNFASKIGGVSYPTGTALAGDIGIMYDFGTLGFLRDARLGITAANLGTGFTNRGNRDMESSYPGVFALKAGFAATLLEAGDFKMAFGTDLVFPTVQNLIVDVGLQFGYNFKNNHAAVLSVGWEANVGEIRRGHASYMPAVGFSYKFSVNTSKSKFLSKNDWQETDVTPSVAWKHLYDDIEYVGFGFNANLGAEDKDGPAIKIGN
ncbi:MAG: hypothetical protein Ta2A_06100 [Treponemataceae bacterium]|nr:MAG: hypothetical protein Ta2A_06100 [Treponemataceae bacterium]